MELFSLQELETCKRKSVAATEKEGKRRLDELIYALTDPVVIHRSPWADTLPGWVREQIIMERLIALMKGEFELGTDAEAMAYIYPATCDAPLDHDWTEIYLYVSTRVMDSVGKTTPPDVRVDKLDSYRMGLLRDLKRWIYKRRANLRPKETPQEKKPESSARLELVPDAMPLFGAG